MADIQQTTLKVQNLLTGPLRLQPRLAGRFIVVELPISDISTECHILVQDLGKDPEGNQRTAVRVTAPILREVNPSPELFEWVARESAKTLMGHIVLVDSKEPPGTVELLMAHVLLGDFLDEAELKMALSTVGVGADTLDDELQEKFGGKRWVDR